MFHFAMPDPLGGHLDRARSEFDVAISMWGELGNDQELARALRGRGFVAQGAWSGHGAGAAGAGAGGEVTEGPSCEAPRVARVRAEYASPG